MSHGHHSIPGGDPDDGLRASFAGAQRHARAILVGAALVVAILVLTPEIAPRSGEFTRVQLAHGRLLEIADVDDPAQPDARIVVLEDVPDGPRAGDVVEGFLQGPSGLESRPDFVVGDEVILNISTDPDFGFIAVSDRYRVPTLAALLAVFAVAVTVVGGWRGVRSLIALALTLVVIVRLVVPLILAGWDPGWVAIVAATGVTVATVILTEGLRRPAIAAVLGTAISLTLVDVLTAVFDAIARFSPLRGSEEAGYLLHLGGTEVDLGGLVMAAVIFGALGVLDDVTMTQSATIDELHDADPRTARVDLAGRAMNVGRSHIAATVNTLVLAYVGSLPLIILFAAGGQDPLLIASGEVIAVEVVRALVGSIGIVAAVPITTAIAVALIGRSPAVHHRSGPRTSSTGMGLGLDISRTMRREERGHGRSIARMERPQERRERDAFADPLLCVSRGELHRVVTSRQDRHVDRPIARVPQGAHGRERILGRDVQIVAPMEDEGWDVDGRELRGRRMLDVVGEVRQVPLERAAVVSDPKAGQSAGIQRRDRRPMEERGHVLVPRLRPEPLARRLVAVIQRARTRPIEVDQVTDGAVQRPLEDDHRGPCAVPHQATDDIRAGTLPDHRERAVDIRSALEPPPGRHRVRDLLLARGPLAAAQPTASSIEAHGGEAGVEQGVGQDAIHAVWGDVRTMSRVGVAVAEVRERAADQKDPRCRVTGRDRERSRQTGAVGLDDRIDHGHGRAVRSRTSVEKVELTLGLDIAASRDSITRSRLDSICRTAISCARC